MPAGSATPALVPVFGVHVTDGPRAQALVGQVAVDAERREGGLERRRVGLRVDGPQEGRHGAACRAVAVVAARHRRR